MSIVRVALPVPIPQLFDYSCDSATHEDIGRCVRVNFGRRQETGVIVDLPTESDIDPARLKPVEHLLREVPPLPGDWLALTAFVARYYHVPQGEVIALALPPDLRRADEVDDRDTDPLLALTPAGRQAHDEGGRPSKARHLLAQLQAAGPTRKSVLRTWPEGTACADLLRRRWIYAVRPQNPARTAGALPTLTDEQGQVIDTVAAHAGGFAAYLLQGVTGAGKTEVYLRLIERALAAGRQVLVLVPEIALTPQLEQRVVGRFPDADIVALHSGVADGARSRGFVRAMKGEADIVLGTRLAIFTPLPRLGLIVVDEEHDPSYKQQEGVRYSARDLAVWRARQREVPLVLGSATPSLESWRHAEQGRYTRLRLTQRAIATHLPTVRLIDTRRIKLEDGLSPALIKALGERLERREQSLLFLNRRGYAPVLSCPACDWISACPHCSANCVVHLKDRRLRCHHCGHDTSIPHACPECGNQDLKPLGRGTQKLEEGLVARFPEARILRVDRDAARSRKHWLELLARIHAGEADILVGTQMMAKGHDFPRLTLVGVIGADGALYAADFRAPERLFQQMMQVGGRAGRAALAGEVLIQTEFPDHPLFQCLQRQDTDAFARMALAEREEANFPPFTFQAMLSADAPVLDDALDFLTRASDCIRSDAPGGIFLYDPVPMRMTRLARRERAQLLVESASRAALQGFLSEWMRRLYRLGTARDVRWRMDVDPLDV
ncbi:primosomal protein N' [Nitrogeniibacter mangrovi]|uniref:Replication restart protein PriA n=1 Tax=Nitrogeniibacter mangrovi TaxID=2016596 RepID=A0A6C1B7F2_9RHOO|nr:primosomal protein N' [Nitrogeniibacter mangrovi]QID19641.1 primosomal protein N' [Nitrogeniibacter mangrovi]